MENNKTIPFGKYKGQPLSVLQNDKQYLDWVMAQEWFIEKYQSLHTIIINNFGEQSKTPEHNQFQAMFLDMNFCEKTIKYLFNFDLDKKYCHTIKNCNGFLFSNFKSIEKFCNHEKDFELITWTSEIDFNIEFESKLCNYFYDVIIAIKGYNEKRHTHTDYNNYKKDIIEKCIYNESSFNFKTRIELKPQMGDDYPAILRKIPHESIVIIKEYNGSVEYEKVKQMFLTRNVTLVKLSEIT